MELFNLPQDRPKFITWNSIHYITLMGSHAYGTATPESDHDFYGFIIPPADVIFPHLRGEIPEFGRHNEKFMQYQVHAHEDPVWGKMDLYLYTLPRYFQLVMEGNPNMVDSLFTPRECVIYGGTIERLVRENRQLFLSQKCWHTFKGMAFSHLHRITNRTREGKRAELVEKYGYDVKDASHMVRCLSEVEQILTEGDLDLRKNSNLILEVRNGAWTLDYLKDFFTKKLSELEDIVEVENPKLAVPYAPDENSIKQLLIDCLEMEYGSLSKIGWKNDR